MRISFRGKLLLLSIVPFTVAQIVSSFAVMQTVEADIDRRATQSLVIGGAVVNEFLASRGEQLRTSVQVLAADFGLKEAVATGDAETIASMLDNHSRRIGADIAMLLDGEGRGVASTGNLVPSDRNTFLKLIDDESTSVSQQSTATLDGITYHTFTVPLRAPVTIGWVVMGFRIDAALANRMASLTGLEVTLTSTSGARSYVVASTTDSGLAAKPDTPVLPDVRPANNVYSVNEAGVDWLMLRTPYVMGDGDVMVVLQRSLAVAMAPYAEARRGLIAFTIVLLALIALAVGWVSGSIAKPLRVLADAAKRMISGRYDEEVHVDTFDEFGELASSFNAMQSAIADRENKISHQALHDPLTDLPNRANIVERLSEMIEQAKNAGTDISVISIGLARMNAISSTLGHSASDEVVTLAARQIPVVQGQLLGHIGTSEFVLILPDTDVVDALIHADRIVNVLSTGVTLGRANINLQAQVGVAHFPQHGTQAAELLRKASIARGDAEVSQQSIATYETGREDYHLRQLRIVNDLRVALQREEIHVHFQPKILLPEGIPCGAEALVRWQHPELGWLMPDDFIPAAEQAGTIVHLTQYVLARAVEHCRIWQEKGHRLQISVNLSARDLQDEHLAVYVLQVLKDNKIDPHRLTLEITENTVMQEIHQAITVLDCLRDIGIRISMDDFGTGYSSLAQLKVIPLHELKIDKSFIMTMLQDKQNEAIVKTTIDLAHNMNLHVVAEGVEDEATIRHLAKAGCEQAQGYFLSKPVTSESLIQWLDNWQATSYADRRTGSRPFRRTG